MSRLITQIKVDLWNKYGTERSNTPFTIWWVIKTMVHAYCFTEIYFKRTRYSLQIIIYRECKHLVRNTLFCWLTLIWSGVFLN